MRADIGDAALVHYDDPIGQRDHAHAMRDQDRGSIAREFLQHLEDELLALDVDLARGLVE